LTYKSTQPF